MSSNKCLGYNVAVKIFFSVICMANDKLILRVYVRVTCRTDCNRCFIKCFLIETTYRRQVNGLSVSLPLNDELDAPRNQAGQATEDAGKSSLELVLR